MSRISIVIPLFNAEKFLRRCLESIQAQTYTNWECILIDDGSTDSSKEICNEYAQKNSRFRVFCKKNGGVASARNLGIEHAAGEWLTFVDADDYIDQDYLESLIISQTRYNSEWALCGLKKYCKDGSLKWERKYQESVYSKEEFGKFLNKGSLSKHKGPYAKLYKMSIIEMHHLRFVQGAFTGEDEIFIYRYFLYCSKISLSTCTGYNYMETEGALTSQGTFPYDNEVISSTAFEEVSNEVCSQYPEYRWIMHRWTFFIDKQLNSIYKFSDNPKSRIQRINQIDVKKYAEWKVCASPVETFLVTLLRLRLFRLYDFLRTLK